MKKIKKMSNKAQALVEFAMIIPIILFLLFIVIDFSNIFYHKNRLESTLDDVITYVKNGEEKSKINNLLEDDISYKITKNGKYQTVIVEEKITLITPFSNLFFDNPYKIKTERTIINE